MRVIHTSEMAEGQVYTPEVNLLMMLAAIIIALYFKQSENLADAYGIAVTGDMFITSMVFYFITRRIWGWGRWRAVPLCLLFGCLDLTFFSACLGKLPLAVGSRLPSPWRWWSSWSPGGMAGRCWP